MCGVLKYFVSSFAARGSTSKGKLLPEDQLRMLGLHACGSNIKYVNSYIVEYRALESWN
jgi:hypothetical protein